jgi:hypothetical protein
VWQCATTGLEVEEADLEIDVQWGKTKIGGEALGLVVSFKLGFVRAD